MGAALGPPLRARAATPPLAQSVKGCPAVCFSLSIHLERGKAVSPPSSTSAMGDGMMAGIAMQQPLLTALLVAALGQASNGWVLLGHAATTAAEAFQLKPCAPCRKAAPAPKAARPV